MKKILILLPFCFSCGSLFALPDYEPFADSTGASGINFGGAAYTGTSYTTGSNLSGQTNAAGQTWFDVGPGGNPRPTIVAGDLTINGLASSGGGQSAGFGGNGTSARLNLTVAPGGIVSDTVYYSFAMKLTDLTGLSSAGVFWAGFNNTQGAQVTTPNTVVTRVVTRSAAGGLYNIGLDKANGSAANFVWDPNSFSTSDTLFLVGSYTFNSGVGDDVSQLWVNPDSSTFGNASAPAGSLSSILGGDIARVASFVLYDRIASEPTGAIDDLRFGLNWADVTPAAVPEPSVFLLGAVSAALLGLRHLRHKSK